MANTRDIEGLQQQTDVEQAKAKLEQVAATKEGRKDPRAGEQNTLVPRTAGKAPATGDKGIRPVTVKPKKKKFGQKLKEAMFSEDIGNGSVTEYVFFKILIPSVKRVLSDMANTAINMALGLDPKTRTIGNGSNTHTANASVYRERNYNRPADSYGRYRESLSELEWDEATVNDIFSQVQDLIEHYGECSIGDVYSIMGLGDRIRTTDSKWGWTTMRGIEIVAMDAQHERNIIDFPSARPLR